MGFDRIIGVALQAPFFGSSLPSPYVNRESVNHILFLDHNILGVDITNLIWAGIDCVFRELVFALVAVAICIWI
jgi:hypothetical protein